MSKLKKLSFFMAASSVLLSYSLQAGYSPTNNYRNPSRQISQSTDTQTPVITPQTTTPSTSASTRTQQSQPASTTQVNPDLQASINATLAWLALADAGQYGETWDTGAPLFQQTMKRDDWIQVMQATRKPLGSVNGQRTMLDIRTASNPKGLPAGDYMVLFYKTDFQNKSGTYELLTLMKQPDGVWKVLTYQVD